jgi:hypothetical protein
MRPAATSKSKAAQMPTQRPAPKMKTFILSILALGFLCEACAITITAYADAPSG